MKKSSKSTIIVTLLVVAALAFLFIMLSSNFTVTEVKTSEFFNHVGIRYTEDGEITYEKPTGENAIDAISVDVYTLKAYKKQFV